ncbi:glycerophosphodiester phosphodiesterase [Sporosarcina siberiensis]|uniref:Glycerophosphodiester phosphodiesterase n=1 Tax=Sporosarcina siberiensis TaxID=1365606 RepID=A0ABW4SJU3_9BACL
MLKAVAHRGWSGKAPENTIAAFSLAIEDTSIYAIELDVHLSKDGVPVVIHDYTLERTTNGKGLVSEYTVEELRTLDVGRWFDESFSNEKIPLLEEVLKLAKGKTKVFIELKQKARFYKDIEVKVVELIQQLEMQQEVLVISFDHPSLMKMKELDSTIQIGLVYLGVTTLQAEQIQHTSASYIGLHHEFITKEFVDSLKDVDVLVGAWTVNDADAILKLGKISSDLIITTNYPDLVVDNRNLLI